MSAELTGLLRSLPPLRNEGEAPLTDGEACLRWLEGLPPADASAAQAAIRTQVEGLNRHAVSPWQRLQVVEQLREVAAMAQARLAAGYADRPLPLGPGDLQTWDRVYALWQAMTETYLRCLQDCIARNVEVVAREPLIVERCLRYTGLQMLERYRARRRPEPALWRQLHALYAYAETRGIATAPVGDKLNTVAHTGSCAGRYAQALLIDLANPYRLGYRQLGVLDRRLDKWATLVTISDRPPAATFLAPVTCDLDSAAGASAPKAGRGMTSPRYLDMGRLAEALRAQIAALRQGGMPPDPDLADGCGHTDCEAFWVEIYRNWCEEPPGRVAQRRPGSREADICFGMAATHFFVGGEAPFSQPEGDRPAAARDTEMATAHTPQSAFFLQSWDIQDESALGYCLSGEGTLGAPVRLNQLVGIRPYSGAPFLAGTVRWMVQADGGRMRLGVSLLAGTPTPVAARLAGTEGAGKNRFVPALLLAPTAWSGAGSLVLPVGWFRPRVPVEIRTGARRTVRLEALLQRGPDFEQVAFSDR